MELGLTARSAGSRPEPHGRPHGGSLPGSLDHLPAAAWAAHSTTHSPCAGTTAAWARSLPLPPGPALRAALLTSWGPNDDKEKPASTEAPVASGAARGSGSTRLMCPLGRCPKPGKRYRFQKTTTGLRSLAEGGDRGPVSVHSASKAPSSGFFPIRSHLPLVFSHLKCNCSPATHRLAGTPAQAPAHCPPGKSTCKGSPSIRTSSH